MGKRIRKHIGLGSQIFIWGIFLLILGCFNSSYAQESSFLKVKVEKVTSHQLSDNEKIKQLLRNLEIPEDLGFIKEVHVPQNPNEQMIINIQDLHCNYEAQKNIANILEHLVNTYNLKLISVEGGSGKIDTTFYKQLPDEKVKAEVADYFLKEARINGTEFYAITTKEDIALYGAEDQEYYNKNLDAFLKALPQRENILEDIAVLENDLNILKNLTYNKRLNELDDHIVAYDNGSLGFEDYIMYVSKLYPEDKFRREFGQLSQLVESINIKNKVNLEQAEKDRTELIDVLTKKLTRLELEEFLKVTMEYKAKTLDALSYHNSLKKLYDNMQAKSKTLSAAWPQLSMYIEYLNKHETLDKLALFNELDTLLERIKEKLYTSYTQKKLDHYLRTIRLARNLFSTKLLNNDIRYIKKYKSDLDAEKLWKFIKHEAKRLNLELARPSDLELMQETLPIIEEFYHYASERNDILVGNTLGNMQKEKECIGILITGGFHTDGMNEYLREKRISYVVIAPKVEKLDEDDSRYINALKGKKTAFEEQLERKEKLAKKDSTQEVK